MHAYMHDRNAAHTHTHTHSLSLLYARSLACIYAHACTHTCTYTYAHIPHGEVEMTRWTIVAVLSVYSTKEHAHKYMRTHAHILTHTTLTLDGGGGGDKEI